jgi:hypothetical protein
MRRFLRCLIAISAAWTWAPSAAWALPHDTLFKVALADGPDPSDGTPVGALSFVPVIESPGACTYYVDWDDAEGGAFEAGCWVNERKIHGHMTCAANSRDTFTTLVTMEARFPCWGFDRHARPRELFMLVGAEHTDPAGLIGLIQWTAAMPLLAPFTASSYP